MYQYENYKNEKGLQRKLEVLYTKRTLLSMILRQSFKLKEDLNTTEEST
jgi:hypothetical protein